jgi:hypothetical protein
MIVYNFYYAPLQAGAFHLREYSIGQCAPQIELLKHQLNVTSLTDISSAEVEKRCGKFEIIHSGMVN